MKTHQALTVTGSKFLWRPGALAFVLAMVAISPSGLAQVVEIPDPVLLGVVRAHLKKLDGAITVADMESLVELNAGGSRSIQSLEGLQAASNLEVLRLKNAISADVDFSPLQGLGKLTTLDLTDNDLTSLTLPLGLTSLSSLVLYSNRLSILSLPDDLSSLIELWLCPGYCGDHCPWGPATAEAFQLIGAPPNLVSLDLSACGLTSLTLPAGLTQLTRLDASHNRLVSLTLPVHLHLLPKWVMWMKRGGADCTFFDYH